MSNENNVIDYDGKWKVIIEELFEDFIQFFMPDLYPLIDFTKKVTFLKQDIPKIAGSSKKKGDKIKDNIVEVHLKNGEQRLVLIHIEIQATSEKDFAERMFVYYYRTRDKYKRKIAAIAIYVGASKPKIHDYFQESFGNTEISYRFNSYNVKDPNEKELLANKNPFAIVVLACKYILTSTSDYEKRIKLKIKLVELAKKRNYGEQKIVALVSFVMNLMILPQKYEQKFVAYILKPYQKSKEMVFTQLDKMLLDGMVRGVYGETIDQMLERLRLEAEEERLKAEEERLKAITRLLKLAVLTDKQIANIYEVPLNYVQSIKKENNL
ncbi:MAG: hypothetical protein ACPGVB_00835 [Chitinophagales bacterium]